MTIPNSSLDLKPLFEYLDKRFEAVATKKDIQHLPSKKDFFDRMDKLSGEIQTVRQEQIAHSGQHTRIHDRLDSQDKRIHALEYPTN
jgi:hypothetical protein